MFQTRAPLFGSLVALGLLGAGLASPAHADTILETAQFTGVDTGEYIISENRFIGAVFTVSSQTQITGIGGQFGGFPAGSIFGAIIALSSPSAFPSVTPDQLPSITIAETVFSLVGHVPPVGQGADFIAPLSATLNAGTYAVLFGSGLFGANGNAGFGWQNTPCCSPTYLQNFFGDWSSFDDPGVRIVVEGSAASPVPGPVVGAGFPGAVFAFGGLVGWWRRKRRAGAVQG